MDKAGVASGARFMGAGAFMGLAFITEYTSALIIFGLLLYAAYILWHQDVRTSVRLGIAGALGALIPLLLMFAYNYAVYGNPFDLAYAHEASDTFQREWRPASWAFIAKAQRAVSHHARSEIRPGYGSHRFSSSLRSDT